MNPLDLNLFWFNPLVRLLTEGLRLLAAPLQTVVSPGMAGGLAIILFTIIIRLVLLPLSLAQTRSQKAMMAVQPELKELQKKFKNDREAMARAQMQLYKEKGVNPAAGCLPLVVQMPILFGMYSAMLLLATEGLTLDRVQPVQRDAGRVVYEATRAEEPLPFNNFLLSTAVVTPKVAGPVALDLPADQASVSRGGSEMLAATQGLVLNTGQPTGNPSVQNPANGRALVHLRPGGIRAADESLDRNVAVQVGQPYLVEIWVTAPQAHVDAAKVVLTYDPAVADVGDVQAPQLRDVPFKSAFLWLPSLGEYDTIPIPGVPFPIPGLLLILMTITSYLSMRMTTMPTEDPQQQAMMRTMAFMPLMYLFFFSATPAGLVLYWLISNVFTMVQQYFTTGLGLLAGDLEKVTGRNLQPAWAQAVSSGMVSRSNGRGADDSTGHANGTAGEPFKTPARRSRSATLEAQRTRGSTSTAGKGRKRGRR